MALVVYVTVPKELKKIVDDAKSCPAWYVSGPGRDYVGLRERKDEAVERSQRIFNKPVTKETHIFLKITFSEAGFAKYATLSMPTHNFAPQLSKMVYYTRSEQAAYDWKVWHWNGDLPLDDPLIESEWVEIGA